MRFRLAFQIVVFIAACRFANGQVSQAPPVRRQIAAVKTDKPPVIDGDLSDPAWKDAPKAETFLDIQNGNPVTDQTTAWILYDAQYIYIGFHCKESLPQAITARETVRDYRFNNQFDSLSEDAVEVTFDPFSTHRQEEHTSFALNALGTRSVRRAGGRASKLEWKGDWDGAVKRVPDGWTAEMRIPWAGLSYPSSAKPVTFAVNFSRYQSRTRIQSIWSNVTNQGFYEREGQWTGIVVPAGAFHPKLSLLPYILPGIRRAQPTFRSGFDARYTITPELTSVASINPDFGTIEGAVEGIQFSRTERFVPETRPFFLEGLDYFANTNVNIIGQMYYPRRIPGFDAGFKVYGKVSKTDTLGFLHTEDIGDRNDTVMRFRHDFGPTSSGSVFFTNLGGRYDNNTVGGLLQDIRWGKLALDWKAFKSTGTGADGNAEEFAWLYLDKHLVWAIGGVNVSPLFRNAEGLTGFTGYRGPIAQIQYRAEWRKGLFRSVNLQTTPMFFWHTDGRPFQRGGTTNLFFETRSDWLLGLTANHTKFDDQTDETYALYLTRGVSNRFRQIGVTLQTGREGGEPSSFVGPLFSVRLFRKFDVAYAGAIQNLAGVTQQHILTMNYELSPTRSFGGRVVVQNGDFNWYLSYRRSGAKGMDAYFIIGDPNTRRFREQAQVKLVFAL